MAMTRRPSFAVLALTVGLSSCTPAPEVVTDKTMLSFQDGPRHAGRETVAVMTPLEQETQELWKALVAELGADFNVVTVPVHKLTAADHLSQELNRLNPQCVVVVDNRTLHLYRRLQAMRPDHDFPPAVVVMTSFLERSIRSLRKVTGVAYEVPAVSSIVALREVSEHKVERVGVVHRSSFSEVVAAQVRLAAVEKVELIPVAVPDHPTPQIVEDSLDLLVVEQQVDALWVLNDNELLSAELLMSSWLPVLRFRPIPVMVGVSALVHPEVHFGTLAVFPHHFRLGVQVANLVFDLADNDWQLDQDGQVELPLSVMTVVDVRQFDDHFGLKPDALTKIDKVVR